MIKPLPTITSAADLHLGHPRVSIQWIADNFEEYVYPKLIQSDIFFLAGDWCHQLLRFDSVHAQGALIFVNKLLDLACRHNIKIRILRGTYSHDRGQIKVIETLNERWNADVRCVDIMSIEHFPEFDLRVLYIPDNLPYHDTSECLQEISSLLQSAGWKYVDLAIVHGYFSHVLPPGIPTEPRCTFKSTQFDFVSHYVLVGHVHTHSRQDHVIYHGSFDRLAHGEEEKKGFLFLTPNDKDSWDVTFVENPNAMPFITISPRGETVDDLVESLERQIKKKFGKAVHGHLRISHANPDLRQILVQYAQTRYNTNLVVIGHTEKQKTTTKIISDHQLFYDFSQIIPTEENLAELIHAHITKHKGQIDLSVNEIDLYLKEI